MDSQTEYKSSKQSILSGDITYQQMGDAGDECYLFQNENNPFKGSIEKREAMFKAGKCNARRKHVPKKKLIFHLQDIFTSLVESRWRVTLLVFALSFIMTWFLFGVLWWIIAHEHGDLKSYSKLHDPKREPCVTMMHDFVSCFLFSLETQYSTGYGSRSPTTECPEAIILLIIQSIFGVLIQSTMAGIVFAKLSRPKARGQQIIFSKKAVINLRDGYLSLVFRVGDFRKVPVLGVSIRAWLLQHRITTEGELLPYYRHPMRLNIDSGGSDAFVFWPATVVHRIDKFSPLFNIAAASISKDNFEIVIILNGIVEATGQTTEARTAYLPTDILWGYRFKQMIEHCREGRYNFALDFSRFDKIFPVDTPKCSAQQLTINDPQCSMEPVISESTLNSSYHTL